MTYNRFDIVLVQFPFSEKRGQKQRPALVLTDSSFNAPHQHAITAMVTTAANTKWPSDLRIAEFAEAGLKSPSVTRFKLFTVAQDLIIGRIGTLTSNDQKSLRRFLGGLFDI